MMSKGVPDYPSSRPSHGRGRRFEPCTAHQNKPRKSLIYGAFFFSLVPGFSRSLLIGCPVRYFAPISRQCQPCSATAVMAMTGAQHGLDPEAHLHQLESAGPPPPLAFPHVAAIKAGDGDTGEAVACLSKTLNVEREARALAAAHTLRGIVGVRVRKFESVNWQARILCRLAPELNESFPTKALAEAWVTAREGEIVRRRETRREAAR